ncbi:MAG: hypothetical protein ACM3KR_03245 [Deltaproteobacteria bacterium]
MNISSISDYYKKLLESENKKTSSSNTNNKVETANTADSTISTKKLADKLDLNSDNDNLGYLNYNAKGQYNTKTLADILKSDSEGDIADLFGDNSTENLQQTVNLTDYLGDGSATGTDYSGMVDKIASEVTAYDNKLILQALKRLKVSADSASGKDDAFIEKLKKL